MKEGEKAETVRRTQPRVHCMSWKKEGFRLQQHSLWPQAFLPSGQHNIAEPSDGAENKYRSVTSMFKQSPSLSRKESHGAWLPPSAFLELTSLRELAAGLRRDCSSECPGLQSKLSVTLRTGETAPEQQMHTAANPSDKGRDTEVGGWSTAVTITGRRTKPQTHQQPLPPTLFPAFKADPSAGTWNRWGTEELHLVAGLLLGFQGSRFPLPATFSRKIKVTWSQWRSSLPQRIQAISTIQQRFKKPIGAVQEKIRCSTATSWETKDLFLSTCCRVYSCRCLGRERIQQIL